MHTVCASHIVNHALPFPFLPCFSLPAEERTVPLATVAERAKLPLDGVEFLLMKTLALHLIEGVIDQVEGTVQVRDVLACCCVWENRKATGVKIEAMAGKCEDSAGCKVCFGACLSF